MKKQNRLDPHRSQPDPLIPLRTLAIFTASVLIGVMAALVTYGQWHQVAQALGVGGISALAAARQLHNWTGT